MSPFKQQIAIAKACGIVSHDRWGPLYKTDEGFVRACPDYLTDLNAMHQAEEILNESRVVDYGEMLCRVCGASEQDRVYLVPEVFRATAAQRAEAFLRTIGKWEESK